MANTYTLISSVTVGSGGASSITFSSIPQTYTDLQILISGRSNRSSYEDSVKVQVGNGSIDTGNNYSTLMLYEYDGTVYSETYYTQNNARWQSPVTAASVAANHFGNSSFYIPNYASSTSKSFSGDSTTENNGNQQLVGFTAARWSGTSAINIITLSPSFGTSFDQYTTVYLYGIKNS